MRKVLLLLFLFALFGVLPEVRAQTPPPDLVTLTAQGSSCAIGSTTAGSFVAISLRQDQGTASFTINANAGGNTISFYSSGDGGKTYQTLSVTPSNSTTTVTSSTASTGLWRASVGSYTNVCMLMSTQASGNSIVSIYPSTTSSLGIGGGGGGGSGTVSGQANGVIPLATASTTIGAQSHMDDGNTTAATITSTEPFVAPSVQAGSTACTPAGSGATGGLCAPESASTGWTPTAGFDYMRADSTVHNFLVSLNGGAEISVPQKICSHVALTMRTSAISSATTDTAVTGTCTGLTTSDTISCTFAANPTSSTGFTASTSGILTIFTWPTSNTINAAYQNNTSGSITPAAQTLNCSAWR